MRPMLMVLLLLLIGTCETLTIHKGGQFVVVSGLRKKHAAAGDFMVKEPLRMRGGFSVTEVVALAVSMVTVVGTMFSIQSDLKSDLKSDISSMQSNLNSVQSNLKSDFNSVQSNLNTVTSDQRLFSGLVGVLLMVQMVMMYVQTYNLGFLNSATKTTS
eukprot:CAMPEP_0184304374 /NCGR_PEP_ID=MMETSP1049-20130417/13909_1 /TAXON_ID=77928 /ORGANISM="Proteomonas sulcata, Strain CCMP704" /LENGTH=157 /DNA_ID=CAMNT_0026616169 /DNA_START=184 /DNA_END=657 /DNA_ORIENTATION=+